MKSSITRLWYIFTNRYFRKEAGPGEPLRFLCGSEDELRRVTTWMCHINPDVFAEQQELCIRYTSTREDWKGVRHDGTIASTFTLDNKMTWNARTYLQSWGVFILKHISFSGTTWERRTIFEKYIWLDENYPDRTGEPTNGFPRYWERSMWLIIRVHSPSAHERAEALLSLSEWLDGKVSAQEKRQLLQLPDDVEV